jgi:hypothetical protein
VTGRFRKKGDSLMRHAHWLTVATSFFLFGNQASAQIKPKVLIVFDTSGSMLSGSKDGSPLCGNQGQDSSIYQLKVALFDVLQGMGADEIDFALATFPQQVDPGKTPKCSEGHYEVTNAMKAEDGSGYNACKISSHSPGSQQTAQCKTSSCPWYTDLGEVLRVPFGQADGLEQILYNFDQQEDAGQVAVLTNPEVRADGGWYTPLGKSLFYAYGYFHKDVVLPDTDYRKSCERLVVAMFTDGDETCNDSTSNAFYPTKWATNLANDLQVTVHTVGIGTDNNADSTLQSIANAGNGTFYDVTSSTAALKQAFLDIVAQAQPPSESCNGIDDDCDQAVDEDFPQLGSACDNGKLGVCKKSGVYVCSADGSGVECDAPDATGTTEECNNADDDCDGEVDEGLTCNCLFQPEVCNGIDDNCNGQIDEGIPSSACGSDIGICEKGTTLCVLCKPQEANCNGAKVICDGSVGPTTETCNGFDDDCDGVIDGMAEICYSFPTGCDVTTETCLGICALGTKLCSLGQWSTCSGDRGPQTEECDGIDNNCDGNIDEQAECPGTSQCINGQCTLGCAGSEFACPYGQLCKDGWCIQDPCNRQECESKGWICKAGECIDPCIGVVCSKKYETCIKGSCIDASCYSTGCPGGERCIQGTCSGDPCSGLACESSEYCYDGTCVSLCETVSCDAGETCQLIQDGSVWKTDCAKPPCTGYGCTEKACEGVRCNTGEVCVGGKCETDLCEKAHCPLAYRCELGSCVLDALGTTEVLATGAGGLTCQLGDAEPPGAPTQNPFVPFIPLVFLGGLLFLAIRRRPKKGKGEITGDRR